MSDSNDFIVISSVWREICVWAVTLNDKWQAHAQCEKCAAASPLLTYQNLSTKKIEKRIGRALQKMPISRLLISRLCVNFRFCVDAAAVAAAPPSTNDDFSSSAPLFLFLFVLDFFVVVAFLFLSLSYIFTIMMEYITNGCKAVGCACELWAHVDSVANNFLRLTTIKSSASTAIATNDFDITKPKVDANRTKRFEMFGGPRDVRGTDAGGWWQPPRPRRYDIVKRSAHTHSLDDLHFAFRISSTARFYSSFFSAFSLFRSRMLSCPCSKVSHTTFRCQ